MLQIVGVFLIATAFSVGGQKCISLFWLRENGEGRAVIVLCFPLLLRRGSSIHEEGASFLFFFRELEKCLFVQPSVGLRFPS